MRKGKKISEFTRICMENHASVTGWQELLLSHKSFQFSADIAITTFEIWLKVYRSPNFNMLFQLMLTKFFKSELFLYLPKVGHVINYWNNVSN